MNPVPGIIIIPVGDTTSIVDSNPDHNSLISASIGVAMGNPPSNNCSLGISWPINLGNSPSCPNTVVGTT